MSADNKSIKQTIQKCHSLAASSSSFSLFWWTEVLTSPSHVVSVQLFGERPRRRIIRVLITTSMRATDGRQSGRNKPTIHPHWFRWLLISFACGARPATHHLVLAAFLRLTQNPITSLSRINVDHRFYVNADSSKFQEIRIKPQFGGVITHSPETVIIPKVTLVNVVVYSEFSRDFFSPPTNCFYKDLHFHRSLGRIIQLARYALRNGENW